MIEENIKEIIKYIGDNPDRAGVKDTPKRVAKAYKELFSGYGEPPENIIKEFDSEGYDQLITIKDIDYWSHCEHHMVPFFGKVHVGYIPDKKIIGLSKFGRVVEHFSRRLQVQEVMTKQIADFIQEKISPRGLIVVVEGTHMCMVMRGVKKINSKTITSDVRGMLKENHKTKDEFLRLLSL